MDSSMTFIPFNKPYLTGKETEYIHDAVRAGKISGDGMFTKKCHDFFENKYGFKKVLLTTSCTDALEMAALLLQIRPGDEIIAPSFTFVSTVNPFVLRGANIVFADSSVENPNLDADQVESLITPKTKAIVAVHYAGIACDMDKILLLAKKYNLFIVEDAAQAVDSYYKDKPLGSFGSIATFSFHETKNVMCGEGGMLVLNDENYFDRAEIIWEKGTNRSAFFRGEVDQYNWIDIGSSFLPSEITAAFLFAQLENIDRLQVQRKQQWNMYHILLTPLEKKGKIRLPFIPPFATNNAHIYYLVCTDLLERTRLIAHMRKNDIYVASHYLPLHKSPYQSGQQNLSFLDGLKTAYAKEPPNSFPNADRYSDCLLRLPMFYELSENDIIRVAESILSFYDNQ